MFLLKLIGTSLLVSLAASLKTQGGVEYFGRYDTQIGAHAQWPGTGVNFIVANNEKETYDISIKFYDCTGNCKIFVLAEINCDFFKTFEINAGNQAINFQTTVPIGTLQEFRFTKITESSNGDATGTMNIDSVSVDGATFVAAEEYKSACPKSYKMLFIGDSITAGYGVDGVSPCTFSASTENVLDSYASRVAKAIGATAHILPWSGKGVVRNYGDKNQMSAEPMPVFYNRTIATAGPSESNYWQPSLFVPDVVLVMLGTNDYSTQPNPSDAQFTQGLVDLLSLIQRDYPSTKIAAMCAPLRAGNQCQNIQAAAAAIGGTGATYVDIPTSTTSGGWGCDGHPNAATQQNMADYVTPIVKGLLGI